MSDDARDLPPALPRGRAIDIDFEGRRLRAFAGEPLAVALFAAGVRLLGRSPKYHRPRGLFCLEGHCGSCALRIDGRPSRRSCLTPVAPGQRCERQNAFPDPDFDLLRAADWLFPRGMDHHEMMTGSRIGNELFLKMVRQMGGAGTTPDAPPATFPPVRRELVDLCVVGAGPAGLAAARAAVDEQPGARVLVVDEQDRPGGSLLAEPGGFERANVLAAAVAERGVRLSAASTAVGYYPEDHDFPSAHGGPPGVLAVATPEGLLRVSARRLLYATGAYDQNLPWPESDRPGVISARACGRLAFRWGVRPGRRVVVLTDPALPFPFAETLRRGLERLQIPTAQATLAEIPSLAVNLKHDALAVAALPAPASDLPRQHGAHVRLDLAKGGFAVEVDGAQGTTAAGVLAAGDVTGYKGPVAAEVEGRAAGKAAVSGLA